MTATEKYLAMNNNFCKLRDAIYESDVEEAEEQQAMQISVEMALSILCYYLDFYKATNNIKTKEKNDAVIPIQRYDPDPVP